ncbi:M42 family metallopeptidase [bacterium]|nr:M42 family metallopeptidase [bacterium]
MDKTEKLLKNLTETFGISGFEDDVARIMVDELKDFTEISRDGIGSLIAMKKGKAASPKIMIAGHMDEIGFLVKGFTKSGFVKFNPIGGWWSHVVLGQRMVIKTRSGKEIHGVVGSKAPHSLSADERKKVMDIDDMFIDVGATVEDDDSKKNKKDKRSFPERLGIAPGDPITPYSPFTIMGDPKVYMSKAWDDRIGVAVAIKVLQELKGVSHPNTVYGVGTVQEEVGLRGATTSAFAVDPDVGFAIDVTLACDYPGAKDPEFGEKIGKGPSISVMDGSLLPNPRLRDFVIETAKAKGIPFQYGALARGGTDGGRINLSKIGRPTLTVSIATRYIHAHSGILHRDDFDNLVKLLVEVVKKLDKKQLNKIIYK